MSEEVEFEGKKVKPSPTGIYKCPYNCGDSRYPTKKWKTKSGFIRHTLECPKRPSVIAKRNEANDLLWTEALTRIESAMKSLPYKIGDTIHYVREVTVKPTHEQRGTRQVRVRYEPVNIYDSLSTVVNSIDLYSNKAAYYNCSEDYIKNNLILANGSISMHNIFQSKEMADQKAAERQKSHDDWREFSSMVR